MKESAHSHFKSGRDGGMFSKRVKGEEKGEIAPYKKFLLFRLCFQIQLSLRVRPRKTPVCLGKELRIRKYSVMAADTVITIYKVEKARLSAPFGLVSNYEGEIVRSLRPKVTFNPFPNDKF